MRIVFLASLLGVFLLSDVAIAEESKEQAPVEKPGVMRPINTSTADYSDDENMKPRDYQGQELPSYQSYDPNTGLTNNTQSDAVGNLN